MVFPKGKPWFYKKSSFEVDINLSLISPPFRHHFSFQNPQKSNNKSILKRTGKMIDLYVDFCSVLGSNWPDFPHVFRGVRGQIGFIPPLGAQLSLEKSLRLPLKPQKPTLCRFEIDFCTIWLPFKGRMGRFLASKRYQYSRLTQRKVQKISSPSGRGRRLQRQHLNSNRT